MALLLAPRARQAQNWTEWFAAEMPDLDLRFLPDFGDPKDIEAIAFPQKAPVDLSQFPNLKLVISLAAGVEQIVTDPNIPADATINRVGDPDGDRMMSEVALLHTLRHHRNLPDLLLAQQRAEWIQMRVLKTGERGVGVLGLGPIGLAASRMLADFGFKVAGWARSPRKLDGIEVFHGQDQFDAFLARSEIVVNLLALTPETTGIFCAKTFAKMPKGSSLINLGRGGHVVDEDLIAAIDSGHLNSATLDVFHQEPLPKESPLWANPRITVTPHCARRVDMREAVPRIATAIRRLRNGEPQEQVVHRDRGY